MINAVINSHSSWSDCETCGGMGSTYIELSLDNFYFCDGEPPSCFSGTDGNLLTVLEELNKQLKEKGIDIVLFDYPDNYVEYEQKFFAIMDKHDWSFESVHDNDDIKILEIYDTMCDEYESFYYESNLIKYYSKFGVNLLFTKTSDPDDEYYEFDSIEFDEDDEPEGD